jgi:hypothetical protein
MPDEVTPERVAAIAAAARVPLEQTSAARVAKAVNPTVTRFAAQKIALPRTRRAGLSGEAAS